MDSDTSRMTGSLLLLLSLLLHIFLLLLIFIFQNTTHDARSLEQQAFQDQLLNDPLAQQQQQQQDDPFDPDHEIMVELLSQGIEPNNTLTDDPGELAQPSLPAKLEAPTPDDAQSDEQESDHQKDDESAAQEMLNPPLEIPAPPTDAPLAEEASKGAEQPEPIADTISGPKQPAQTQQVLTPKQAAKKIIRKMVQRPTITPAQAQTLSKIAQGFMQSMSAELGNAPSNDPTQLARQRYMTKLWNNLKQTMNAENNVLALSDNIDTQAVLVLTINKQGKLLNALLRHPRKTPDINKMETMLLTNAHKVGLFPPLPESFKRDEVTFVMPIHLRAQQGIHSGYRLQVEP